MSRAVVPPGELAVAGSGEFDGAYAPAPGWARGWVAKPRAAGGPRAEGAEVVFEEMLVDDDDGEEDALGLRGAGVWQIRVPVFPDFPAFGFCGLVSAPCPAGGPEAAAGWTWADDESPAAGLTVTAGAAAAPTLHHPAAAAAAAPAQPQRLAQQMQLLLQQQMMQQRMRRQQQAVAAQQLQAYRMQQQRAMQQAMQQPMQEPPAGAEAGEPEGPVCPMCTFRNAEGMRACEMCGTPLAAGAGAGAEGAAAAVEPGPRGASPARGGAAPLPEPPDRLRCPLTLELFEDPVIILGDEQGAVYERRAIEAWLCRNNTVPNTQQPLVDEAARALQPLHERRREAREWREQHAR